LGQDSDAVLLDLGITADQISEMRKRGIVG